MMTDSSGKPSRRPEREGPPALTRRAMTCGALVSFVAAVVVLAPGLTRPDAFVFDEVYYASDALDLLQRGVEQGQPVHPPLGKWMIAGGIRLFGFTPLGWRIAPLLAGAAVVALAFLGAALLTRRTSLAAIAAALVLFDGVAFTASRLAMLDVFVALWTTATVVGVLWIRQRGYRPGSTLPAKLAVGLLGGAAVATKWSAVLVLPLAVMALFEADRRVLPPGPIRRRGVVATLAAMTLAPMVVYAAAAVPFLVQIDETRAGAAQCRAPEDAPEVGPQPGSASAPGVDLANTCDWSIGERLSVWWENQLDVLAFHRGLRPRNSQAASATHWVLQTEPTALYDKTCRSSFAAAPPALDDGVCDGARPGDRAIVMSVGNPVLWLTATLAVGVLAVRASRRRDVTIALVLSFGLVQWLPWTVAEREVFTFYAAPIVPLLAWWVVMAVAPWSATRRIAASTIIVGLAVLAFAGLRPAMTASPLARDDLGSSLWYPSWP